ncbi:MAG: tetratricopeptide repeat protein [Chthoniobacterales bacterium]
MRLSRLFPSQQHLFAAVLTVSLLTFGTTVRAEDSIKASNGIVRTGQITGVRNGSAMIKSGPAEIGIPLSQVTAVTMAQPTAVDRGLNLQEAGKPADALAVLKPVVDQFGGLPLDWAQRATASIGDLYLSLDKTAEASAAYAKFKQLYPGVGLSLQADVGMARVAAANNKFDDAKTALTPIIANALTKPDLTKAESAAFGQAYFTLGNIAEKENKPAEALEDYLRTVTIFYADRATTARAQERADALRKNGGIAVP